MDAERPAAGEVAAIGQWEAEARARGVTITQVEGLRGARVVVVPGCDPLFALPVWASGALREYMIGWALCELHRLSLGAVESRRQIARAIETLTRAA